MKKYTVQMTQAAINDLETIYTYISNVLLSVDTAKQQCSRILEKINSLETFPKRNRELYLKENIPYHQIQVDKYAAFYSISDDTVTIFRILYSASNLLERLEKYG